MAGPCLKYIKINAKYSRFLRSSPRRERRNDKQRDSGGVAGKGRRAPADRRVFVSNIPFEMRWQEVKDMFREQVGDVTYVEMFSDENEKPRGCGILEFANGDLAKKAVEKMHRYLNFWRYENSTTIFFFSQNNASSNS